MTVGFLRSVSRERVKHGSLRLLQIGQSKYHFGLSLGACPWRIDIVASFEPNVTMLHWVKTAEWDFR
jgi:hypothetical protein